MPLPFSVTLMPPYLIMQSTTSTEDISSVNTPGRWAEVMQVNASTTGIAVGDVVYYIQDNSPQIVYTKDGTVYNLIDESNVYFIAP
jgi:hypothetical protein